MTATIDTYAGPITRASDGTPPVLREPVAPSLSRREVEVLLHWIRSDSKAAVGAALYISVGTVNTHLMRIRAKYEAVGRPAPTKAAIVARALQDGLVDIDDL